MKLVPKVARLGPHMVLVGVLALLLSQHEARAHVNPPGCAGNGANSSWVPVPSGDVLNGTTVTWTGTVFNNTPGTCQITGATVKGCCPGADGSPALFTNDCPDNMAAVQFGCCKTLATGVTINPDNVHQVVGSVTCLINTNVGVTQATAALRPQDELHDTVIDTVGTFIDQPSSVTPFTT